MLALVPTPIGVGPRYHPPPAIRAPCTRGPLRSGARVHLELFANKRVVIIPAGVGVLGARMANGRIVGAVCRADVRTLDPTGVFRYDAPTTLGRIFRVWGRGLDAGHLLSFRGSVRLYRNGVLRRGDPRTLPLRDGDEIVVEVNGFVPPHRFYRFPRH